MATTTFTGPVVSNNGFTSTSGTVTINGTTVIISDLPTLDPSVEGQLWNNAGTLAVSAG